MSDKFELDMNLRPTTPEDLFQVVLLGKTKEIRFAAFEEFLRDFRSSTTYLLRIKEETKDVDIKSICEEKIKNDLKVQYFISLIDSEKWLVKI
jgi:hypothetical protein